MTEGFAEAITMGDIVLRAAAEHAERDALAFPEERVNWSRLATRASGLARGLIGLGVEPGEHVGVLMANSPDCAAAIFAVTMCGAVLVPINTRYRAVELPYVVTDAGLRTIVTSDRVDDYVDLPGLLAEALPGLDGARDPRRLALEVAPELRSVAVLGTHPRPGTVPEGELLELSSAVSAAELDRRRRLVRVGSTGLILYTSGTTALPRGAILAHESLVRNWTEIGRVYSLTASDRVWVPCPMFHLAGIGPLMMCAATGAALLSDTFFSPDRGLALLERERATILYSAYPPITQGILAHPDFDAARLPAARAMLNVAPPDTLRQMQTALPQVTQLSLYGLTEGGGPIANNRIDDPLEVRLTTCGRALPGCELRIVDPRTRQPLPLSEPGEISIRGVTVAKGYHRDTEKTAAQFDGGRVVLHRRSRAVGRRWPTALPRPAQGHAQGRRRERRAGRGRGASVAASGGQARAGRRGPGPAPAGGGRRVRRAASRRRAPARKSCWHTVGARSRRSRSRATSGS